MKVTYDPDVDVLRILFSNASIEESDEEKPGVILDYGKDGCVLGIEILDASKRMENPMLMEYTIVGDCRTRHATAVAREKRSGYGRGHGKVRS